MTISAINCILGTATAVGERVIGFLVSGPGALVLALVLFAGSTAIYRLLNKGLSRSAKGQQLTRQGVASLLAAAPFAIAWSAVPSLSLALIFGIAAAWMVAYPGLFYLTHRRTSPDIDNYMDISFGLYAIGWLSSAYLGMEALAGERVVWLTCLSAVEWILAVVVLAQVGYYLLYKVCFDPVGVSLIRQTDANEIIEFIRSYPLWVSLLAVMAILLTAFLVLWANMASAPAVATGAWVQGSVLMGYFGWLTWFMFNPRKGVVRRTGLVRLFLDEREYARTNERYRTERAKRLESLEASALVRDTEPSTIVVVIGESASRDYMSAFTDLEQDSTPWMRRMAQEHPRNFFLFPNAYSSHFQTVPTLERALTEMNQYNDREFYRSCSIIDVAQRLGYRVYWYSNQGNIGFADTPITLMAETADVARWTLQQVNKMQYDTSLLDFLAEVDSEGRNLVFLHLMGSHFNYLNRYPAEATVWGEPGVQDNILNYLNSLRFTDSLLEKVYDYGREHLHLDALLYFSDHATVPDRHRSPRFDGFGQCRIPMALYLSDRYEELHPQRAEAAAANCSRPVTNDLVYDLLCGLLDCRSTHFDETQSILSPSFRFKPVDLRAYLGTRPLPTDEAISTPS